MTTVDQALAGINRLGFDSSPIIYLIELHARYNPHVEPIFRRVDQGLLTGKTSAVTLAEVLVRPLTVGDSYLQWRYKFLLSNTDNFDTVPINIPTCEAAADLRARYNLRLGDALQLAVAIEQGCQAFLTNDLRLKRVSELRVLVLDELEP